MPPLPRPKGDPDLWPRKIHAIAQVCRKAWQDLSSARDLPLSVRLTLVMCVAEDWYRSTYKIELAMELFVECVGTAALMSPMKEVNSLFCKTCRIIAENRRQRRDLSQTPEGPHTFLSLLNHFRDFHIPQTDFHWTRDMVELPHAEEVANLVCVSELANTYRGKLAMLFP